ncbi:MAG: hypothetical protein KC468_21690 [Myxococcales bacterium]|nr:hypothetical protein [Myxococcales bacterium]
MTRRAASARGYFARQIIPPDSPASVGQYQLRVADDGGFELVCRVLLNTLEERDWRSEWSALWGRVTEDGDALTFHVERGQREVRSCAWDGRGVEDDYRPTRRFTRCTSPSARPSMTPRDRGRPRDERRTAAPSRGLSRTRTAASR